MADTSATARLRSTLRAAHRATDTDLGAAVASLWLLLLAGVAAPAAALSAGPRSPTTAAGATQALLLALAPAALLYVPHVARRDLRPAVGSDRAAVAVAAGAGLAAVAAVGAGAAVVRFAGGVPTASAVPALGLVVPVFGLWLHRRGRAAGRDPDAWATRHLLRRGELLRPWRLVAEPRKAGNAALVGTHALVLVAAGNLAWRLAARGSATSLLVVAGLAYGGWFVGQAFVVGAGVWRPWQRR